MNYDWCCSHQGWMSLDSNKYEIVFVPPRLGATKNAYQLLWIFLYEVPHCKIMRCGVVELEWGVCGLLRVDNLH